MEQRRKKELDKALKKFSTGLSPNFERQKRGRIIVDKIFDYLRRNSHYDIDRSYIGGSSGKKTAADAAPDFDLVVFVNREEVPFENTVIEDFVSVLSSFPEVTIEKFGQFSIQLVAEDFEIDLLPASNYISILVCKPPFKILAARQALVTLQKIQTDPINNYYRYSSALAETALEFVKNQEPFVHEIIRVCKYWNKNIPMPYVSGRSTIIELIAIKVGMDRENDGNRSLLSCFTEFLMIMKNFDDLQVQFDFDPLDPIKRLRETNWGPQVNKSIKRKPFLIEPANPFNNLASGVDSDSIETFKMAARNTLEKLESFDPNVQVSIKTIFEQPKEQSTCQIL